MVFIPQRPYMTIGTLRYYNTVDPYPHGSALIFGRQDPDPEPGGQKLPE
jgi:hypothetical protein